MKTKASLLIVVLAVLFGCQQSNSTDSPIVKKGMIKMTIFYPNGEGKTFDMDYYSKKHMPMAQDLLGESLKAMAIDKGLGGGTPDDPATYLAIGSFYFESMTSFQNAMGPVSDKLRADVPNYTNVRPVVQISEVQTLE